jgi:hypothetical protein
LRSSSNVSEKQYTLHETMEHFTMRKKLYFTQHCYCDTGSTGVRLRNNSTISQWERAIVSRLTKSNVVPSVVLNWREKGVHSFQYFHGQILFANWFFVYQRIIIRLKYHFDGHKLSLQKQVVNLYQFNYDMLCYSYGE